MPTSRPAAWVTTLLIRELEGFERELALFVDDRQVWQTAPGVTNATGTLVLHVCGNLQHFVGAVLGGTGYVRDRAHEFSARDLPRTALLAELGRTKAAVLATVPRLTDEALAARYPEAVGGIVMVTGQMLTHLSAHLAFHLGQAGYLRRLLNADPRSAGPLPLPPLADRNA